MATSQDIETTAAQHRRTSEVFLQVYDLPRESREAVLRAACGDDERLRGAVAALLEMHDREACEVDKPPIAPEDLGEVHAAGPAFPDDSALIGQAVGHFRITRLLSSGGMGTVFEAEQEHPHRVVALKIMRRGLFSPRALSRFTHESELLARMEHPGIAQVFEAGTFNHAGVMTPYFAMQLVAGARTVTDFAEEHKLDVAARLMLFEKICRAIHHGHLQGVVHRDIKPANILVGADGEPKVIDFGIARSMDADSRQEGGRTLFGQVIGTPQYMSPEQFDGDPNDLDMRTDVYSLGVVLYELLCGRAPFDVEGTPLPEAMRRIRDESPARLGSVSRMLRGDLESIVAKALEKERERRYQSAAAMADDIRRFLEKRPITAQRPSTAYLMRRLVQRNRTASIIVAVLAVGLVAALVVSIVLAIEAGSQRDAAVAQQQRTQRALDQAKSVAEIVARAFNSNSIGQMTIPMSDLVAQVEQALVSQRFDEPEVEAMLRTYLGQAYLSMQRVAEAETQVQRAIELRTALAPDGSLDLADSLRALAVIRFTQTRQDEGEILLRQCLEMRRRLLGPNHMTASPSDSLMGAVVTYLPNEPEARKFMQESAGLPQHGAPPDAASLAAAEVVLREDFDGEALDPQWLITTEDLASWRYRVADSRLSCTAIEPMNFTSDRPKQALAILAHPLPPLQDFRIDASIGWNGDDTVWTLQCLEIVVFGAHGNEVCRAAYADHWTDAEGERLAIIHRGREGEVVVRSGMASLPNSGAAEITLLRSRRSIAVLWNGRLFARGFDDEPIAEVQIWLHRLPYILRGRRAHFGELHIDRVEVRGVRMP